ncbi:nuclear transport factor 2 family protein [Arthrobacter castelli]|uniref:nuclear transport factor 2 family protein n=1 Tax=Arthrobacter castelli TaxID=271431 RepID=UPI000413CA37|nr:nuclear transport factor 2 family protein [Arthrobacter castelli]
MANKELLVELLEIEHRGWSSLCDGTGADFYGSIMIDDGVMVLAHGVVMDRDAVIASLNEAPPWRTYEISDARLVNTGDDAAVVVYTGRAYRDGVEPAFVGLMSSVYVRKSGGWRLALYQQTVVPAAEG